MVSYVKQTPGKNGGICLRCAIFSRTDVATAIKTVAKQSQYGVTIVKSVQTKVVGDRCV